MSAYIDAITGLTLDTRRLSLICPGCGATAHLTPIAVPSFAELTKHPSDHVGVVYRCDACQRSVFLRHPISARHPDRIELAAQVIEVEHAREKFAFGYLPRQIETLFRGALDCYAAGAYAGFSLLCRQIALAMFHDLGAAGRLRVFEELDESRELAAIPQELYGRFKDLLFGPEPQPDSAVIGLTAVEAGVLLEVMKDVLSQCYVRKARLQRALKMRELLHASENPST